MKVPNIIHFCYFGGRPFDLVNYLAVKSAFEVNHPKNIFIYIDIEPENNWWQRAKKYLTLVKIKPPEKIFGKPLLTPAHKANIVRLEKLIEYGGIYLDLDVICHKPFTPLLDYEFTLGKEEMHSKVIGLCNAVILSEKNALFAQRWLEGFDPQKSYWKGYRSNGNDKYFTELGVKYPNFLSMIYPEEIHIEDRTSFYFPNYSQGEISEFFETDSQRFANSYCYHLWARAFYEKYLQGLKIEEIKRQNTAFNRVVQPFIT